MSDRAMPCDPSGMEWLVEASGCDPNALADRQRLSSLFERLIAELDLHPVEPPVWHAFAHTGGLTGVWILSESHLAFHTFPEHGSVCLNLFCCRRRPEWDFEGNLKRDLGAAQVRVRRLTRNFAVSPDRHLTASQL